MFILLIVCLMSQFFPPSETMLRASERILPYMGNDSHQPATGAEHLKVGSRPNMPSINMRDNLGRNKQ